MSSLPVPLSPWMSTGRSEGATRSTVASSSRITGSSVTIPSAWEWPSSRRLRWEFSRRSRDFSAALATSASSSSMRAGLVT